MARLGRPKRRQWVEPEIAKRISMFIRLVYLMVQEPLMQEVRWVEAEPG